MAEELEPQPGLPQQANLTARPPFPIHVLPPKIRAMAEAVAAFMTTGKDLSAAVAMTVLNAAICGGVRIMHRGHPERVTPSGTFNVSIGVSGSGKSVIGGLLMKPIFDFEREAQERFGRDVRPGLEAEPRGLPIDPTGQLPEPRPPKGQPHHLFVPPNPHQELSGGNQRLVFRRPGPRGKPRPLWDLP